MTDAMRPFSVETLLAERVWVEGLARSLVADDATAADIVQQTWLAAIESPPTAAPRGWLARVVRNAAFQSHRAAGRRARHESAAPTREAEPSPADTVARADAHRRVVDAVMSLDEPYRTAVLLRFFEGLESADVARRTGVPVETARTRIKRALALLRGRLDRDAGGDGRAWALALVPLLSGKKGVPAGAGIGGAVMAGTMKTAIVAAALVGAVAGSSITWLATGAPSATERDTAAAQQSTPLPPAAGSGRLATRDAEVRSAPSVDAASSASKTIEELAAGVQVAVPRRGSGVIAGRVLQQDGSPLAGATVRAWLPRDPLERRWRRGRVSKVPTLEEAVRAAVEDAKWSEATRSEATTGADGTYALRGLVDAAYSVRATCEGYDIHIATMQNDDNFRPGSTVDFAASTLGEVPVTVLLPDGSSPERVAVRWTSSRGSTSSWWFRDDPSLAVETGEWSMSAELGTDLRAAPVPLRVEKGRENAPVVLQLVARNIIDGTVRLDPADAGWDAMQVNVRRRGTLGMDDVHGYAVRPPNWRFRIEDVERGEYDLTVSLDGGQAVVATDVVTVTGGLVTRDVVVPKLGAAQFIWLRVLRPDGEPLAPDDFEIRLVLRQAAGYAEQGTRSARMPNGSIRVLLGRMQSSDTRAQNFVSIRSKTYGTKDVAYVPGTTERVDVAMQDPAHVDVTIAGAEGRSLEGRLSVTLRAKGSDSGDAHPTTGDAPDRPFEPGEYVARLWLGGERRTGFGGVGTRLVARTSVTLRSGPNAVTLRVPELQSFVVRVPGADRGTRVYLEPAQRPDRPWGSMSAETAADGTVRFDELTAGLYVLRVAIAGDTREMVVRVPAQGEQTFVATTIAGLTVTIDDATGIFGSWGLTTGDVIVAIDDTAIDTVARADALLLAARGHDRMRLDVLRGGRRMSLSVDPGTLGPTGSRGGFWEPVVR